MAFSDSILSLFGWQSKSGPSIKKMAPGDIVGGDVSAGKYYSNAMSLPYERRRKYDVFDDMDEIDDVSTIMDAYAEDATQESVEHKSSIWIEAEDKKVKTELEELQKRLNWDEFDTAIARDIGKYGDDFAILTVEDNEIVGWDWADPRDIERIEHKNGTLLGYEKTDNLGKVQSKFGQNAAEKVQLTYKPWDVVHFRLYRRKRRRNEKFRNIYGTSLMEGSERVTKQLRIMSDMLVIHRLTASLDKMKYGIYVGEAPTEEEIMILKRWKNIFKRKAHIDPTNSKFDAQFDPTAWIEDVFWPVRENGESTVDTIPGRPNVGDIVDIEWFENKFFGSFRAPKAYFGREGDVNAKATLACLVGDTKIPLLDGTETTIKSMVENPNTDYWVYSYDLDRGRYAPGKVVSPRPMGYKRIWEVTLDNNKRVECTGNHPFLLRDGSYKRVDKLNPGDSLMPLYRSKNDRGYDQIQLGSKYTKTHQMVAREMFGDDVYKHRFDPTEQNVIHHMDFDKLNNDPNNLVVMSYSEHYKLHSEHFKKLWRDPKFREKQKMGTKKLWGDPLFRRIMQVCSSENITNYNESDAHRNELIERHKDPGWKEYWALCNSVRGMKLWDDPSYRSKMIKAVSDSNTRQWQDPDYRAKHTERLRELSSAKSKVACSGEKMKQLGFDPATSWTEGRDALIDSGYSPYGIPTIRCAQAYGGNNHKVVSVKETSRSETVYDIEVSKYHNFALSAGVIVHNSQDMKWGRSAMSLQRATKNGFARLSQIQLALKSMDPYSKFTIGMVPASSLEELTRLEAMNSRLDAVDRLATTGETLRLNPNLWRKHVMKAVLGMSDQDIELYTKGSPPSDGDDDKEEPAAKESLSEFMRGFQSARAIEFVPDYVRRSELPIGESVGGIDVNLRTLHPVPAQCEDNDPENESEGGSED